VFIFKLKKKKKIKKKKKKKNPLLGSSFFSFGIFDGLPTLKNYLSE
jgi:hypothetical protein